MVLGDSLLRDLPPKFQDFPAVHVRVFRGAYIQTLTKLFTTSFVEKDWKGVTKLLLLIGTNHVEKYDLKEFEFKYRALLQIIRARLGDIDLIVCTIPPRPKDFGSLNSKCKEFNFAIRRSAVKAKARVELLHKAFLFEGRPKSIYFCDGLHLSALGVTVLVKVVKRFW